MNGQQTQSHGEARFSWTVLRRRPNRGEAVGGFLQPSFANGEKRSTLPATGRDAARRASSIGKFCRITPAGWPIWHRTSTRSIPSSCIITTLAKINEWSKWYENITLLEKFKNDWIQRAEVEGLRFGLWSLAPFERAHRSPLADGRRLTAFVSGDPRPEGRGAWGLDRAQTFLGHNDAMTSTTKVVSRDKLKNGGPATRSLRSRPCPRESGVGSTANGATWQVLIETCRGQGRVLDRALNNYLQKGAIRASIFPFSPAPTASDCKRLSNLYDDL